MSLSSNIDGAMVRQICSRVFEGEAREDAESGVVDVVLVSFFCSPDVEKYHDVDVEII